MNYLGVVVPVVTPCTPAGEIDREGLQRVCGAMMAAGNAGVFVMGSTGRGAWFPADIRARATGIVRECLGGTVPIFAGCMGNGIDIMLEHARAASDAGANVAVVTAPGYFRYLDDEVVSVLLRIADRSPLPVLLYDVPVYTNTKLGVESIVRLLAHERVVGLKDSTADALRLRGLLDVLRDTEAVWFLQGKEHLLGDSMLGGGSGMITTFSHFAPRLFISLCEAGRDGDRAKVDRLQKQVTSLYRLVTECLDRRPAISTLFHMVNIALQRQGLCGNILLEHEGECPPWLHEKTTEAMAIAAQAEEMM